MRVLIVCGLVLAASLGGCSCDMNNSAHDDLGAVDLGVPDEAVPDLSTLGGDGGALLCNFTSDCPPGQVCLAGVCQTDPCKANDPCGAQAACLAVCVPTADPCAGVTCKTDETCVNGACVQGCFRVPCNGVSCPTGQYCSKADGQCHAITACN